MRDYIFRGFYPCEDGDEKIYIDGKEIIGRWVRSRGAIKNKYYAIMNVPRRGTGLAKRIEVIPQTVSLFTGKYDHYGKEIFEDDIVLEEQDNLISTVIWDDELGTFRLEGLADNYCIKDAHFKWSVKGNRFSNPEIKLKYC